MARANQSTTRPEDRDNWMFSGVGYQITRIDAYSLVPSAALVTNSVTSDLICSYNWKDQGSSPAVYVPGGAAKWMGDDIQLPKTLQPDRGYFNLDENAARTPRYPFEVVLQAVEVVRPSFRFDDIDMLVNRNSLAALLDFCNGRSKKSFRLDLYAIKNTLVIERCERRSTVWLNGSPQDGYGHNFEREFTQYADDVNGSTSHHRVLQYRFGDLNLAVRCEVDAALDLPAEAEGPVAAAHPRRQENAPPPTGVAEGWGLPLAFGRGGNSDTPAATPRGRARMLRGGVGTPQGSTAEIKTGNLKFRDTLRQLWFGRTPHLIHATHESGVFREVAVEHMTRKLAEWEGEEWTQLALRKLVGLLSLLREITKRNGAVIVTCERYEGERLRVFGRWEEKSPLPEEMIGRFWSWE